MDIHPPEGPTHSIKDFLIHIGIVTIGILIALGLEGVRENWRENRAVSEAREHFREELSIDRANLEKDRENSKQVLKALAHVLSTLPEAANKPAELSARVSDINPALYFFGTTAWESATATGVLSHMDAQELARFTNAYLSVKNYLEAQKLVEAQWISLGAYFRSHRTLTPAEEAAGEEKLRVFQLEMTILDHVGGEFERDLRKAIGN